MKISITIAGLALIISSALLARDTSISAPDSQFVMTKAQQQALRPVDALEKLFLGNLRFLAGKTIVRNDAEVKAAMAYTDQFGQSPFGMIHECIDSRSKAGKIFDVGIGDLFIGGAAGATVGNLDIGGFEFGTSIAGAKIIVLLGHSRCGAAEAACAGVDIGNIEALSEEMKEAAEMVLKAEKASPVDCSGNPSLYNKVAKQYVINKAKQLRSSSGPSEILHDLVKKGELYIYPAMYDIGTGKVTFFDNNGNKVSPVIDR